MIQTITKEKTNYIDVTDEWLKLATPNSHKVLDRTYFEHNGIKYFVDGKNIVLDYSSKEKEVALWLERTFGGEIYMLPRINKPDGIKTADYLWNGEYWDLKEIKSNGKRVIDNRVRNLKRQAQNYILDITNNVLSNYDIIEQIDKIFKSNDRNWLNSFIIKKENNLIKVFVKKD